MYMQDQRILGKDGSSALVMVLVVVVVVVVVVLAVLVLVLVMLSTGGRVSMSMCMPVHVSSRHLVHSSLMVRMYVNVVVIVMVVMVGQICQGRVREGGRGVDLVDEVRELIGEACRLREVLQRKRATDGKRLGNLRPRLGVGEQEKDGHVCRRERLCEPVDQVRVAGAIRALEGRPERAELLVPQCGFVARPGPRPGPRSAALQHPLRHPRRQPGPVQDHLARGPGGGPAAQCALQKHHAAQLAARRPPLRAQQTRVGSAEQ